MKTLYITRDTNILVDAENNTANKINQCRIGINNIYLAEEPMHVVYGYGEYHKEADVEKGDIIVTFYIDTYKHRMIIINNNDQWVENIIEAKRLEQEEKERWAAQKSASESIHLNRKSDE